MNIDARLSLKLARSIPVHALQQMIIATRSRPPRTTTLVWIHTTSAESAAAIRCATTSPTSRRFWICRYSHNDTHACCSMHTHTYIHTHTPALVVILLHTQALIYQPPNTSTQLLRPLWYADADETVYSPPERLFMWVRKCRSGSLATTPWTRNSPATGWETTSRFVQPHV